MRRESGETRSEAGASFTQNVARTFQQRSARVIGLCRLLVAATFVMAVWIDPGQPVRSPLLGYVLLDGYLLWSVLLLAIAWVSWWWDHKLAVAAFLVDCAAFLLALWFTESTANFFVSPFMAFFAFLMLSTTVRWDWKTTTVAAFLFCMAYLLTGLVMSEVGLDFDGYRFGRRVTYMIALAFVLVWFGANRGHPVLRLPERQVASASSLDALFSQLLPVVARLTGAGCVGAAWEDNEEPWISLARWDGGTIESERRGPESNQLLESVPHGPTATLLDLPAHRFLRIAPAGFAQVAPAPVECGLADWLGAPEGITFSVETREVRARFFVAGISGVSSDDVRTANDLTLEIAAALDRFHLRVFAERDAEAHIRTAIARDLHDTVAQVLAGVGLRLDLLRDGAGSERERKEELAEARAALKTEEANIRSMIGALREGRRGPRSASLDEHLRPVVEFLNTNWRADVTLSPRAAGIKVGHSFGLEFSQLMREAVANAVRHGKADRIDVDGWQEADRMHFVFKDNGRCEASGLLEPRSLTERTHALGGEIRAIAAADGATIEVVFPKGAVA